LRTAKRFFLNSFNDLSAHVISGSYHITPGELDQFGEFAVVQPVPEPGTLLLFWIGLGGCLAEGNEIQDDVAWPAAPNRLTGSQRNFRLANSLCVISSCYENFT
jgi:hypothetical protein